MIYLLLIIWLAYWSAESGASLPWSSKWQDKVKWFSEVPEGIISLTIASVSVIGLTSLIALSWYVTTIIFILATVSAYAGKQSATRAYLRWKTHIDTSDRDSTLRPLYRFLAGPFGWKSGDEGYAWIVALVKGFIMTPFMFGLGAIFFTLGHEVGSHADGRLPGDANMWKELSSGIGLGIACVIWLIITEIFKHG